MSRLRRSDPSEPGIRRRRRGRGFEYRDELSWERIGDDGELGRIAALAIPPAWTDVWVCREPRGHIQATGFDAKGRKQYRYHDRWRRRRDAEKFDGMLRFARALPALRRRVEHDLALDGLPREKVLACAVRLLELGCFRIGSEDYAERNDSYGLATMRKRHVGVDGGVVVFDYPSKGGKRRVQAVADAAVCEVVQRLRRRRGGSELLAFKDERGRWCDVRSEDINERIKQLAGDDFSAKDFRTWNATLLAAVALVHHGGEAETKTARKRAITRAVEEVASYLGNSPTVCRASYIDPRVFDRYRDGLTVAGALAEDGRSGDGAPPTEPPVEQRVERAVLGLIADDEEDRCRKSR